MSPLARPGAARRSPFATLALLAPLALAASNVAAADPLAAYGSYVGEDHSHHDHHHEVLREIDLSEADLSAANFTDAQLRAAILVDAIAIDAMFTSANLWQANASGADLTGANLSFANLKETVFTDAVLWGATLAGSELKDADFRGAHLIGADLSYVVNGNLADFTGAYFDADTLLDPAIDASMMYFAVGTCPGNPSQYWIDSDRDGNGDTCQGAAPLPEPDVMALFAGLAMLRLLARRRA